MQKLDPTNLSSLGKITFISADEKGNVVVESKDAPPDVDAIVGYLKGAPDGRRVLKDAMAPVGADVRAKIDASTPPRRVWLMQASKDGVRATVDQYLELSRFMYGTAGALRPHKLTRPMGAPFVAALDNADAGLQSVMQHLPKKDKDLRKALTQLRKRITAERKAGAPYESTLQVLRIYAHVMTEVHHRLGTLPSLFSLPATHRFDAKRLMQSNDDVRGLASSASAIAFPTFEGIGFRDLAVMWAMRIFPVQLPKPTESYAAVDGRIYVPGQSSWHDIQHALDSMRAEFLTRFQVVDSLETRAAWLISVFETLDAGNHPPEFVRAAEMAIFGGLHEVGIPWAVFATAQEKGNAGLDIEVGLALIARGVYGDPNLLGPDPRATLSAAIDWLNKLTPEGRLPQAK